MQQTFDEEYAIQIAHDLASEYGENEEYDRGMSELLRELFPVPDVELSARAAYFYDRFNKVDDGDVWSSIAND